MVQNCPNITNPSGSSQEEQLVPKRLTLLHSTPVLTAACTLNTAHCKVHSAQCKPSLHIAQLIADGL